MSQWYATQQKLLELVRMDTEYKQALQVVRRREHLQKSIRTEMLTHNIPSIEVDDGTVHASLQFVLKTQTRIDTKALPLEIRDAYSKEVPMYCEQLVITPNT